MSLAAETFQRHAGKASRRNGGKLTRKNDDEVIYQIYPRSFADSNGDGQGDINGIISRLDYLKSLGVDGLWVTPINKSPPGPGGDGGYAVEDSRSIDPAFGTIEDFKRLLDEAHKRGLKVYMDFVLPHTANTHKWFEASSDPEHPEHEKYKDFYVWHPGNPIEGQERPGLPNNWKSVFGKAGADSAWTWSDKRKAYYMHHFLPSQPALNLNRRHVQDSVFDDMQFWLDMGVDGFRLDSVPFANFDPQFRNDDWLEGQYPFPDLGWDKQYLSRSMCQNATKRLIQRMRARFPGIKLMGEVIAGRKGGRESLELAADYVKAGLDYCYTTYERAIGSSGAGYIRGLLGHIKGKFSRSGMWYTVSTHDGYEESPRTFTRVAEHLRQAKLDKYIDTAYRQALCLFASVPGMMSIFQGDELALPQASIGKDKDIPEESIQDLIAFTKGMRFGRDGSRTPFPFDSTKKNAGFSTSDKPYLPMPESHRALAVDLQQNNPNSPLSFTKDLIQWRKDQSALRNGKMYVLKTHGDTLAFIRINREQAVLCVFNLGPEKFYFKPADILGQSTLERLGLTQEDVLVMHPFGWEFAGKKSDEPGQRWGHVPECPKPESQPSVQTDSMELVMV